MEKQGVEKSVMWGSAGSSQVRGLERRILGFNISIVISSYSMHQ